MNLKQILVISLLALGTWAIAGDTSSGGGNAKEEMVRAMMQRLVAFSQQTDSLVNMGVLPVSSRDADLLDGIGKSELDTAIINTKLVFLKNQSPPKTWDNGRFKWTGTSLVDTKTNEKDRDAIYVAALQTIFFDEHNWDELDEVQKYLLLRKEYWRIFSKQDAPEMRVFLVSFFKKAEDLQLGNQSTSKDACTFDGTLASLQPYEGYYNFPIEQSEGSKEQRFTTFYLDINLEEGTVTINNAMEGGIPYWYQVGPQSFTTMGAERYNDMYGKVASQGELSEYKNTLWVSGSTIFTKYIGNKYSYLHFSCDDSGHMQLTLPKVYYRLETPVIIYRTLEKFEKGFVTLKHIPQADRTTQALNRVDTTYKQLDEFVDKLLDANNSPASLCKSFVDVGWGLPSACKSQDPNVRFLKLVGTARDQFDRFRSGILDPVSTYGATSLRDRVYLIDDGRAVYTYNPTNIFEERNWNQRMWDACLEKNSEFACEFYIISGALSTIEHNDEPRIRFEAAKLRKDYCGYSRQVGREICLAYSSKETTFWDRIILYGTHDPSIHVVSDYIADDAEKWVEITAEGIDESIIIEYENGLPTRAKGPGFDVPLAKTH